MPKIGSGPALPPVGELKYRIPVHELDKCTLEALIRLGKFLETPLYENLAPGLRKHYLARAIARVEKAMYLGGAHPYKKATSARNRG